MVNPARKQELSILCFCHPKRQHRPTANPCGCDRCTECAATLAFEAKWNADQERRTRGRRRLLRHQ
jgi:hypothetical protein